MDPNWPVNPPDSIICALCRTSMPFDDKNPERFFRHLIADHCTYFNLNLLLEISQMQPSEVREENLLSAPSVQPAPSVSMPEGPDDAALQDEDGAKVGSVMNVDSWEEHGGDNIVHHEEVVLEPGADIVTNSHQLDLCYLVDQLDEKNVADSEDFSELDPISFVRREPKPRRTRQSMVNKNNQPVAPLPENPNRHLVPEDLKNLIVSSNASRSIKFTYSQRMNTQMVMNDFVLKKKKGPYMSRGGRIINWKCVNDTCQFTAVTWEGEVQDTARSHNHPPQPELYVKKQARLKIRENILHDSLGFEDRPMSNLVNEVVNGTNGEVRQMIGSIDALKQAARRFNRKLHKDGRTQESPTSYYENFQQFFPVANLEDYEVVQQFPVDLQFVAVGDNIGGYREGGEEESNTATQYFKQEPITVKEEPNHSFFEQSKELNQPGDDLEELLQESPSKQNLVEDELSK